MFKMLLSFPIQVYEEKDEKDSLRDSQNFRIWSKVYDLQKWNSPINVTYKGTLVVCLSKRTKLCVAAEFFYHIRTLNY